MFAVGWKVVYVVANAAAVAGCFCCYCSLMMIFDLMTSASCSSPRTHPLRDSTRRLVGTQLIFSTDPDPHLGYSYCRYYLTGASADAAIAIMKVMLSNNPCIFLNNQVLPTNHFLVFSIDVAQNIMLLWYLFPRVSCFST